MIGMGSMARKTVRLGLVIAIVASAIIGATFVLRARRPLSKGEAIELARGCIEERYSSIPAEVKSIELRWAELVLDEQSKPEEWSFVFDVEVCIEENGVSKYMLGIGIDAYTGAIIPFGWPMPEIPEPEAGESIAWSVFGGL